MSKISKYGFFITTAVFLLCTSCRKWLPEDQDYLSSKAVFTQTEFHPVLGRTTLYSRVFNTDNSTTPIDFRIVNVRYKRTGKPTDDLEQKYPVWVWKDAYTGYEKSVEEINAKRVKEERPLWQIRENSGDLILWASADSTRLQQLPEEGYLFDVIAENSGGSNVYRDLLLAPYREQAYEPNVYNRITGEIIKDYPNPVDSSIYRLNYIHPALHNIVGDSTDLVMKNDSVRVLFRKTGDGNSLTFKFLNKDSVLINPSRFNRTVWDSLIHGFNVKVSDTAVRYEVAYPIPLVKYRTRFTNSDGSQASVNFAFDRVGFGNVTQRCSVSFSFAIYQKGDWNIIFYFYDDNPKFRDE